MTSHESNQQTKPGNHSCSDAWMSGAVSGCLAGLVAGMIWGIIQEKNFIFRNMTRELHLREPPIQLFSVMMRGTKTMAISGTFFGLAPRLALTGHTGQSTCTNQQCTSTCRGVTGFALQSVQ